MSRAQEWREKYRLANTRPSVELKETGDSSETYKAEVTFHGFAIQSSRRTATEIFAPDTVLKALGDWLVKTFGEGE